MQKEIEKINKILKDHEGRIIALEGNRKKQKSNVIDAQWYKSGSTIDKLMNLVKEGFFEKPKLISDMVLELKNKDYHLKASDLTLPLRRIVRKQVLRKTNKFSDGKISPKWLYVEV
jgi:hypothetical protein